MGSRVPGIFCGNLAELPGEWNSRCTAGSKDPETPRSWSKDLHWGSYYVGVETGDVYVTPYTKPGTNDLLREEDNGVRIVHLLLNDRYVDLDENNRVYILSDVSVIDVLYTLPGDDTVYHDQRIRPRTIPPQNRG